MMPMLFKVHLGQLGTNSVYEKNTKILKNAIPSTDRNITECGKNTQHNALFLWNSKLSRRGFQPH